MQRNAISNALSRHAPTIVVVTLCLALVLYWADAPVWLAYILAIIVGSLALILMAVRDRRRQLRTEEEPGSADGGSWLSHELAGNGSPAGTYMLGFFSLVTIMLTGVEGPSTLPAWAALALCVSWGVANARYPAERSDP